MKRLSNRTAAIDSSGIRRVFDLAASVKDPINLSIGQPNFDASPRAKEALQQAAMRGDNGYTVTQGIPALRHKVKAAYGVAKSETEIDAFVTSGVSGGLMLSYMVLLDPGDEILVPDPFFCMYRDLATLINAVPVFYDTYPEFSLPLEKMEALITPKTRAILLNSPGNPTGYTYGQSELDAAIELARKHDLWVIYDEIYDKLCFDSAHANAWGSYEKTIILNGFSKSHGVPGWRIGYALGPRDVIQEMCKVQQYSFVCAPSIVQHAIAETFDESMDKILPEYKKKRDFICDALAETFSFVRPGGAFYLFPEAPGGDGQAFVERCIENRLLVVPGNVFSEKNSHFRISFSASTDTLERGAEVLLRIAK